MKIKIHLHGHLRGKDYQPITVDAVNIAEAVKCISVQLPEFQPNVVTGYKRIIIQGFTTVESLFTDLKEEQDVHIFPQFCGGKKGGFLQILIGAALIAASFIPGLQAFAPMLLKFGALMLIGGLLQLMQTPKRDDKATKEENKTYYLGAPRNTVGIGTRIPILYGRRRIGGHYLSFDINATETGI